MNFASFIARRYFFSAKIPGTVHVISAVSMLGVLVGSAALIIILSVFNGFEKMILSLYNSFDPDFKIEKKEGKYFTLSEGRLDSIAELDGVVAYSPIIEENTLAKFGDKQTFGKMKAMDSRYLHYLGIDSMVFIGEASLTDGSYPLALVGSGVAGNLSLSVYDQFKSLKLYIPDKESRAILNPRKAFKTGTLRSSGIFSIQKEFDDKYIIVPLSFGRDFVDESGAMTSFELIINEQADISTTKEALAGILGDEFRILDRFEQHSFLYKILRSERVATYLILTFVLLIAAFNLIGSLTMLAIEKKKDSAILASLGARGEQIKRIFLYQGLFLSLAGALVGLGLGALICWIQQTYGIVSLGGGSFVLEYYPVDMVWTDFILVLLTVGIIGFIASYYPARTAFKTLSYRELNTR